MSDVPMRVQGRGDVLIGFEEFRMHQSSVALLEKLKELENKPATYVIYPNDLEVNVVHKCILLTRQHRFADDTHGKEYRYIQFPAIAKDTGVFYGKRDMYDGKPFVIMFPTMSFLDMFNMAGGINFLALVDKHLKDTGEFPALEIHFIKKTKRRYRLIYLGLVTDDGREIDEEGRPQYFFTHVRKIWEDTLDLPKKKTR